MLPAARLVEIGIFRQVLRVDALEEGFDEELRPLVTRLLDILNGPPPPAGCRHASSGKAEKLRRRPFSAKGMVINCPFDAAK